jgi:hypothetical protein
MDYNVDVPVTIPKIVDYKYLTTSLKWGPPNKNVATHREGGGIVSLTVHWATNGLVLC